jgi:hypothetical protein
MERCTPPRNPDPLDRELAMRLNEISQQTLPQANSSGDLRPVLIATFWWVVAAGIALVAAFCLLV